MARRRTSDRGRAEQVLQMIQAAIASWQRTDTIRSELPEKFQRMIPASRLAHVRSILGRMISRGLVRQSSPVSGLGYIPALIGLAIVGGAASIIAIAAAFPAVQREFRRGRSAEHKAQAARALFLQEQRQAARFGPDVARRMAKERHEEISRFVSDQAEPGGDGAGLLPTFSLPDVGEDKGSPLWEQIEDLFTGPYKWALAGAAGLGAVVLLTSKMGR